MFAGQCHRFGVSLNQTLQGVHLVTLIGDELFACVRSSATERVGYLGKP
jgi:hypothetical protein